MKESKKYRKRISGVLLLFELGRVTMDSLNNKTKEKES